MEEGYCSIESKIRGVARVLACSLGPFRLPPVAASPLASHGRSRIPGRSVSAILQPPGSFLLQIHSIYCVYSPGNAGYARAYLACPVAPSLIIIIIHGKNGKRKIETGQGYSLGIGGYKRLCPATNGA